MVEKKILVVGSANIDFLLKTSYVPKEGETLVSDGAYCFVPGGKGANAAVAAARLGADVSFCTRVGDDAYGDRLIAIYRENGIAMGDVTVDKNAQTGLAVVMLEQNGSNRIIVYPGANSNISREDIDASFYSRPDIVVTNCEISEDSVTYLARRCREKDIPLVLDFGGARRGFPLNSLGGVEIISPNESETLALTGIKPDSLDDCLRACIKLCAAVPCKYVVLKLGERGCYIYNGKYCRMCTPYPISCVDSTAAGDAFTAAMAYMYIKSGDITAACNFANAVGALTVSKVGAITSLPTMDEVTRFVNSTKQI